MIRSTNRRTARFALLAATALTALAGLPAAAMAQDKPADAAPAATADDTDASEIVVTGTSKGRVALDTPLAVSQLDQQDIARTSTSSQADILNTIPTIKADGGGGEVATNVFVAGLPSGGQYQFTPLMYDGIPVLSSFGLNSSAYDVYYRNDLGIKQLEFVRGGVSNLFGPGSVAGMINYISVTGTDQLKGTAQVEVAEKGRYKGDIAISGPLAPNLTFALSGWYRKDDGPIRTGLDTEGYQVRGNLKYAFPDGSGSMTLYGQYIDDQVQFYLPLPLDGTTRNRIAGNDGKIVYSVQTPAVAGLGFNTPDGPFTTSITDGVTAKGGQIALVFEKDFGDSGWAINGRVKYSNYKHKFGLWADGDGLVNVPETQAAFLSNATRRAQIPELLTATTANSTFTYVGGGAVPANAILFANRFTDRNRPMHDFTAELNLTKKVATGNVDHAITLGGFYGHASAKDITVTTMFLAEFNNQPRLVNLTVTNGATTTVISRNGLLNAGVGYVNNEHKVERYAAYFADQMEFGDKFSFDIGVRVEHVNGTISRERTSTSVTDATTPNLSTALRDVIWGNDGFLTGKVKTTEWAAAFGMLYKLSPDVSLYANGSRGYFFPEIRAVSFFIPPGTAANANVNGGTNSYTGEIIKQGEFGIKVRKPWFSMTAGFFFTRLDNRRQVIQVNNGVGGFTEAVNLTSTESYGADATLDLKLLNHLHFAGNLTIQQGKYKLAQSLVGGVPTPNPAIIGKDLERQPEVLYNAGLYYDDGMFDASFFTNYTGDNYTASTNTIRLKGWNVANFDAGVKIPLGGMSLRVGVNVFNLFDSQATTEGSPRQDINQTVGGAYFVGRPVLPRRVSGRVTLTF